MDIYRKITAVEPIEETGGAKLTLEHDDNYDEQFVVVSKDYVDTHAPVADGTYGRHDEDVETYQPPAA